jgi:SAM-dependent methyltransferase
MVAETRSGYDAVARAYVDRFADEFDSKPFDRDMRDLAFGDGTLAGIAAFYSIIHIPRDEIPAVLAEQRRLLSPGGLLLLAFHEGDRVEHIDEFLGEPVSLDFVFFTRAEMADHLDTAGFELVWGRQRRPYPDVEAQTERTYLLSRRPI